MSNLRNKMYDYEVNPPSRVWNKIADELDDAQPGHKYPVALHEMEVAPRTHNWDNIQKSLNNEEGAKVIPLPKRIITRYAVAALLIGALAFTIVKLTTSPGKSGSDFAQTTSAKDSGLTSKSKSPSPSQNGTLTPVVNEDEAALEESKKIVASLDKPVKNNIRRFSAVNSDETNDSDEQASNSIYTYEDHVPDISNRYIMLMTPDGNLIRMSKKWSNLVCCVSGAEQDEDCKDQLKKWQEKIATSTLAPSPGNFMDILSLVSSLDDEDDL